MEYEECEHQVPKQHTCFKCDPEALVVNDLTTTQIVKWLENHGNRVTREAVIKIKELEKKANKFDECRELLGTKEDDRYYESSTFANLRFVIGRSDT